MSAIGRAVLNYFGSKVSSAHLYPEPEHDTIIEPFAGGAGYSLLHWSHDVILCDISPPVVRAWQYVIRATPEEILALPLIEPGQRVSELDCCEDARLLIGFCVQAACAHAPCQTLTSGWQEDHGKPQHFSAGWATIWGTTRRARVAWISARIKHWCATLGTYTDLENQRATWFVDPPYVDAGRNYPFGSDKIDYRHLSDWCRSRDGQVIVCENEGADWLPFAPVIRDKRGATFDAGKSRRRTEVLWTNDFTDGSWRGRQLEIAYRSAP